MHYISEIAHCSPSLSSLHHCACSLWSGIKILKQNKNKNDIDTAVPHTKSHTASPAIPTGNNQCAKWHNVLWLSSSLSVFLCCYWYLSLVCYWGEPEQAPQYRCNRWNFCLYIYVCICIYGGQLSVYLIILITPTGCDNWTALPLHTAILCNHSFTRIMQCIALWIYNWTF